MKSKPTRNRKFAKRKARRGKTATAFPANRLKLVRIGNSRGVRLPKAVIEQANLGDEVELVVRDHEVILKSLQHPRSGWDELMQKAVAEHGAELTDEDREWLEAPLDAALDPWEEA